MKLLRKPFEFLLHTTKLGIRVQEISFAFSWYGITEVLTAHGLELGKRGLRYAGLSKKPKVTFDALFGQKLAKCFIRLGPTFIKLGQILATRPDIVGDEIAFQFQVLYERVPPLPYAVMKKVLIRELGKNKIKKHFKDIDPTPLASASLAQTHRATLTDGTPVILKIQKPKSASKVILDLHLLKSCVRTLSPFFPAHDLGTLFDEFEYATLREIDYIEEAKNIRQFKKNTRSVFGSKDVKFPDTFPKLSTEKVLTLEPMHGKKMTDIRAGSTVARKAANQGVVAVLQQIFEHGFFHADPHAGNLFFMEENGQIGFIDLGLVGRLEAKDKKHFLKILFAVLQKDRKKLSSSLYEMGTPSVSTKLSAFEKDISSFIDQIQQQGVDKYPMDQMVGTLMKICRQNGLKIPVRYILMIRTLLILEGTARGLDPNISMMKIAKPIVLKSLIKSYNPLRWFHSVL